MNELPPLFHALEAYDPEQAETLLPMVYEELRRLAANRLASQPAGHTLQATALVHEAFLRLIADPVRTWADRRHFFASAAEAMRHILVDRARKKAALKHGGGAVSIPWEDLQVAAPDADEQVIAVNEALDQLAVEDPRAAELVKLHFFGGFTFIEAAELLGISERTAKRMWAYSRAWLFEEIQRIHAVA